MDQVQEVIQIVDRTSDFSIHTEKELGDFLAKEINIPIPWDTPQWRMWIIEDYNDRESAIMFKEHHVMADGIGILEIIMLMTDEFKPDAMIDFRPTTWCKQMILYCISPLFILYYLLPIIFKRRDKFSITNTKLSGEKHVAIGKRIAIEDIKRSAKEMDVSLNDICAAAISCGLSDYLKEIGDEHTGPMSAMIPVNLRTSKPRKPSDVRLQNNFTLVLVDFMIGESLESVRNTVLTILF